MIQSLPPSRRWTSHERWADPWFKALSGNAKLVLCHLWDCCDNAGFWRCDFEKASLILNADIPIDWNRIYREMNSETEDGQSTGTKRVYWVGDYWWLPSYIVYQYGHKPIFDQTGREGRYWAVMVRSLKAHGMMEEFKRIHPEVKVIHGSKPIDPNAPETPPLHRPKTGAAKVWDLQRQISKLHHAIFKQHKITWRPPGSTEPVPTPAAAQAIRKMQEEIAKLEAEIKATPVP